MTATAVAAGSPDRDTVAVVVMLCRKFEYAVIVARAYVPVTVIDALVGATVTTVVSSGAVALAGLPFDDGISPLFGLDRTSTYSRTGTHHKPCSRNGPDYLQLHYRSFGMPEALHLFVPDMQFYPLRERLYLVKGRRLRARI